MLKKIYRPLQKLLLKRHLCVGCTYPLDKIKNKIKLNEYQSLLQCKCKRKYIYDSRTNTYKRATLAEEKEALNKTNNIQ